MSQLLDDGFEQPNFNKDVEILRNRIFIMAGVCGLLWLNLRYFFLAEAIVKSKPVAGSNEDYAMSLVFVNMSYLAILLFLSYLFITFSIESTKKHFMDNAIALISATTISAMAVWIALLIVGVFLARIFYAIGFPERIIPDISFLVIAVGCFGRLYYSFRKKLEVK